MKCIWAGALALLGLPMELTDRRSVVGLQQTAHGYQKLTGTELANPFRVLGEFWPRREQLDARTLVSGNQSQSDAVWFPCGMRTRVISISTR